MKAPYIKDKQNRKNFLIQEEKLLCLKSLKKNQFVHCKWWARYKIDCFEKQSYKNRCTVTYRGRSTNQAFKMSRLEFRRWALAASLPGVVKGSW